MAISEITPSAVKLDKLVARVAEGDIKIPAFQRHFVWNQEQVIDLLDSIYHDYPVGSILLWNSHDKLKATRNICGFAIPDRPTSYPVNYVLDGHKTRVSQDTPQGALWFLRSNGNLFNVAITRARALLLVIGDWQAAANCGVDYYEKFASYVHSLTDNPNTVPVVDPLIYGDNYPPVANPEDVSEWEKIFYKALYMAGLRPVPQYKVEHYALDLALFTAGAKLNVEIDGEHYHKDWNGELLRRDRIRNSRLIELGWDVKRFWVYQIRDDLDKCVEDVANWLRSQQPAALAVTA